MRPVEQMSYEEALKELQDVVETLERGDPSLEEAMQLFERGRELLHHCTRLLTQARLKLRLLTEVEEVPEDLQAFLQEEDGDDA